MVRRNRVDPFGDLVAAAARGNFTGNRGCLVDATGSVVRHHRGSLWITCVLTFGDRRHPLDAPGTWTPVFFLDDAVALAAGHRPCGECRRPAYRAYRDAVSAAAGAPFPLRAGDLDRRLTRERLRRGRGIDRRHDRLLWTTEAATLPDGAVVLGGDGVPQLVVGETTRPFGFDGWGEPGPRPKGAVTVLTPPTSVAALTQGFVPELHETATG